MQIRTTMGYHYMLSRMEEMKRLTCQAVLRIESNWKSVHPRWGCKFAHQFVTQFAVSH